MRLVLACSRLLGHGIKFIGADLFSGAGGSSWGARCAQLPIKAAYEICKEAVKTYNVNHCVVPYFDDMHETGGFRAPLFGARALSGGALTLT